MLRDQLHRRPPVRLRWLYRPVHRNSVHLYSVHPHSVHRKSVHRYAQETALDWRYLQPPPPPPHSVHRISVHRKSVHLPVSCDQDGDVRTTTRYRAKSEVRLIRPRRYLLPSLVAGQFGPPAERLAPPPSGFWLLDLPRLWQGRESPKTHPPARACGASPVSLLA